MSPAEAFKELSPGKGWFKAHVLPLLLVFPIPIFSWWFFNQAEAQQDNQIRAELLSEIAAVDDISPVERAVLTGIYQNIEVSKVMASRDPELLPLQEMFEPVSLQYAVFRWSKRISLLCLGSSLFALGFVGLGVMRSLRSQEAQYQALRLGWPVLRAVATIQVLGQGLLAVALSFWVTALWFGVYSYHLIGIVAIFAICGVVLMLKAMFFRPDSRFEQAGELLAEADAPELWARVRDIATRLGTSPPDQIVVGIDAGFFVTEHEMWLEKRKLTGRTLFMSLPLLKILSVEEADAVLGHEMAHFSGEDTMWTRKVSPLMQRMTIHVAHMSQGVMSLPVFHFLHFFWKLYQVSLGKMRRLREFRADQIGAEISSPSALAGSLVKVGAYCTYRDETEEEVMLREKHDQQIGIAQRLEQGFPTFLSGFAANPKAALTETGHPFDTHPSLRKRIEALSLSTEEVFGEQALHLPATRTWLNAIVNASEIEDRQWYGREKLMTDVREINHVMKLVPETDEEHELVAKHFPHRTFQNAKGETAVLDHIGFMLSTWAEPVAFEEVDSMEIIETIGKKTMVIDYRDLAEDAVRSHKFQPEAYQSPDGNLLDALVLYYGWYKEATAHQQGKCSGRPDSNYLRTFAPGHQRRLDPEVANEIPKPPA